MWTANHSHYGMQLDSLLDVLCINGVERSAQCLFAIPSRTTTRPHNICTHYRIADNFQHSAKVFSAKWSQLTIHESFSLESFPLYSIVSVIVISKLSVRGFYYGPFSAKFGDHLGLL